MQDRLNKGRTTSGVYTLRVINEFAAAHTLVGYDGPCQRMHGHNWKVETELRSQQLDDIGMAIDFKTIKSEVRRVIDDLDHRYLNELAPFARINPTAENIAAYLFRELSATLNNSRCRVSAVTLWETDRACVRYSESGAPTP